MIRSHKIVSAVLLANSLASFDEASFQVVEIYIAKN